MSFYRSEIDGLRAIAILPVIFFHAGFQGFSGGFVGVDIFFVISGYLISSIIFREHAAGTFTLRNFYERRARRILPALFLVTASSIPLAWLWMTPADMLDFSESLIAIPLFFSNFLFYSESGYFDAAMEMKPLFHTWSLGVEEQFYMLFPLLVIFLWSRGLQLIGKVMLGIFVISLLLAEWSIQLDRMFTFFMLPTRMWEMSLGVGVALVERSRGDQLFGSGIKNSASILGLMMIGYAVVLFDQNTPVPGYYALMPTVGTVLIILFSHNSWVGRLIGNRLFVGVGLVSYSAYLWHQPLFAYLRIYRFGDTKVGQYASAILITFLLAYLTWRFIERPFRDRSVVQWRRALAVFLVVGVGLVGFGVAGVASNGFEAVYEARLTLQERLFLQNAKELSELRNQPHDVQQGSTCLLSYEEKDSFHQRFKECVTEYGPAAAIMGDSHASNMKSALLSTERYPFVVWIGGWHCHPYHHSIKDLESGCDFDQIAAFLQQEAPNFSVLLYNQLGSYFILDEAGDTLNHKSVEFAQSGKMEVAKDKIGYILSYLEPISQQIPVVWLASWIEPRYPMHQPRKMIGYGIEGLDYIPDVVDMFVQVDRVVKEKMALLNSSVRYVELYDPVAGRNFIELFEGDCVAFNDKDHLSRCGERIAGPIFDRKIRQALQSVQ